MLPILLTGCTSGSGSSGPAGSPSPSYRVGPEICREIDFTVAGPVFGEDVLPDGMAPTPDNPYFISLKTGTVRCGVLLGGLPGKPGGFVAVNLTVYDSEEHALVSHSPSPPPYGMRLSAPPTDVALPASLTDVADEVRFDQRRSPASREGELTTVLVRHKGLVIVAELTALEGNAWLGPDASRLPGIAVALAEDAFVAVRDQQPR